MAKKMTYVEPMDYIPKSVRKKRKIGEYSEAPKKTTTKSKKK